MIITTHMGDRLDLTNHVYEMVKLSQKDFGSVENTALLSRLG
jgi:hypothetical protein